MNFSKKCTRIAFGFGAIMLLAFFLFDTPILGLVACIALLFGHVSSLISTLCEMKKKSDRDNK